MSSDRSLDGAGWLDVSVPIRTGMVHYPGNPPVLIDALKDLERGDPETLSQLSLSVHTGTHMDAPIHFIRKGTGIDRVSIETLLGAGIVILEGLDLSKVSAGWHDLICLPLKLVGRDGAPARALVRPRGS